MTLRKPCTRAATAAAVAALSLSAPAGAVSFSDSSFNLAGYAISGPLTSDVNLTLAQCATCGPAGDAALRVAAVYPALTGSYRAVLLNTAWTYDPGGQGALLSVDAATDKRVILNFDIPNGLGNSFRPLIAQGGQFYAALLTGPTIFTADEGWKAISGNLTAAGFQLYDFAAGTFGTGTPDFSSGLMTFGLLQLGSRTSPFPDSSIEADYDNLVLTLNAVPETGSAALLLLGLAGMAAWRRRHRQPAT
jgi:MYXO-CTERM domain-containing protein